MKRKYWVILALLFIVPGLMLTASCAKKAVKPEAAVSKTDTGEKTTAPATTAPAVDSAALAAREKFVKQDVNFAFDSAVLDATAQAILKDKAAWLKANAAAATTIEGHCDERGTVAYNIALGESCKSFPGQPGHSGCQIDNDQLWQGKTA
jgi:peptidoglycan-associated lipoprotein